MPYGHEGWKSGDVMGCDQSLPTRRAHNFLMVITTTAKSSLGLTLIMLCTTHEARAEWFWNTPENQRTKKVIVLAGFVRKFKCSRCCTMRFISGRLIATRSVRIPGRYILQMSYSTVTRRTSWNSQNSMERGTPAASLTTRVYDSPAYARI